MYNALVCLPMMKFVGTIIISPIGFCSIISYEAQCWENWDNLSSIWIIMFKRDIMNGFIYCKMVKKGSVDAVCGLKDWKLCKMLE